ncbi:MAG: hypothetical protein COB33_007580 [Thiotrichaceae bacterium]|nr:hypothetical protein [Thiotrichaceae bacterium]
MPNKISIDNIGDVKIPDDISTTSEEEKIFWTTEVESHSEHKHLEGKSQALEIAKQQIRTLKISNDDLAQLGPHRRKYSWWVLVFTILFVFVVTLIVGLSSWQIEVSEKEYRTLIKLEDEVLITLLATTTVQVVGLLYVVARWLFPTLDKSGMGK